MDRLESEEQKSRLLNKGDVWVSECGTRRRTILKPECRPNGDERILLDGSPLDHIEALEEATTIYRTEQRAFWYWVSRHNAKVVDGQT